jgi:ribonuclease P protein component
MVVRQTDPKNILLKADRINRRPAFVVDGKGGKLPKTIKKRRDFLKIASSGKRFVTTGFILQIGEIRENNTKPPAFGYTTSKKVGNAVERNRVRRQLREIARLILAHKIGVGRDFVLVGRRAALNIPLAGLLRDALWVVKKWNLEEKNELGVKNNNITNISI